MKVKYVKNSKGFSLVELLVVLALLGMTIVLLTNILLASNRTHKVTIKEYFMQSDIRRVTEVTNELTRYSKAIFAVPQSFVESTDVMDPGWSYLMLSLDSKRIVIMEYDEILGKHVENVAVESSADVLYYIEFEKDEEADSDRVLKFSIFAYDIDEYGNKTNEILVFESTVEALNAIQVEDKGTESAPSVALAFRYDGTTSGEGKNQIAYITIVIDTSGSMRYLPNGNYAYDPDDSKIAKVKEALVGDGSTSGTGIIQQFAKEENVFISLVPFATTANTPFVLANTRPNELHGQYEVYESTDLNSLLTTVGELQANGGTNTGDAVRRAYYLHENYKTRNSIPSGTQVHHYIIMLVDGQTTYEASYVDWEDDGYYEYSGYREWIGGTRYYRFNWRTDWDSTTVDGILPDGNINLDYLSDDPADEPLERESYYYGTIRYYSTYYRTFRNYTGYIVKYGDENDDTTNIRITGNGSSVITDNDYVDSMGTLIKNYDSDIKSYIIGYATDLSSHIEGLGTSIGSDPDNIYAYDDDDFDLYEVFENIATDILADYWLAAGPQIMN